MKNENEKAKSTGSENREIKNPVARRILEIGGFLLRSVRCIQTKEAVKIDVDRAVGWLEELAVSVETWQPAANPPAPSQPDPLAMLEEMQGSCFPTFWENKERQYLAQTTIEKQTKVFYAPTPADAIRAAYAEWVLAKSKNETNDTKGK